MSLPATKLRAQIEGALAHQISSALTPHACLERPIAPTGVSEMDLLLEGGFPVGAITEIVGSLASGRASCAQAFVAQRILDGQVCAWVDVADSFDPASAAANQVDLERLLWVRCGTGAQPDPRAVPLHDLTDVATSPVIAGGGGSPHPRGEGRGLSKAVASFFTAEIAEKPLSLHRRNKSIGTPGVANRSLDQAPQASPLDRTEQVAYDRLPARRGAYALNHRAGVQSRSGDAAPLYAPRCAESQRKPPSAGQLCSAASANALIMMPCTERKRSHLPAPEAKPWKQMDQALRVTDLLLQTGGFAALVLDLGTLAPAVVNRIPLATWFRFRAAADRTRTSVVLLTQHPCAQTSAELVLRTSMRLPEAGTVLSHLAYSIELIRQRFKPTSNIVAIRKGPQRASITSWQATPSWVAER